MTRVAFASAVLAGFALVVGACAQSAGRPLIYGGNSGFPPYEFLDDEGQPQGVSVELVRAISRATGVPVEIRLAPWPVTLRAFETGDIDFVSLTRTPEREKRFVFLDQYWTHRYVVGFAGGRAAYPASIDQLHGEVIAVQRGAVAHELLTALPEPRRPAIVLVTRISEAMPLLVSGEVTGIASSELTLRLVAAENHQQIETVTLRALPFHFATRGGQEHIAATVSAGMAMVRRNGEYEEILERWVVDLLPPPEWKRYMPAALGAAAAILLVLAGVSIWNRSLRRKVALRTEGLKESERRYRELVEGSPDAILILWQDKIVYVNPAAVQMLGALRAEDLIGRGVLELVHPDYHGLVTERHAFVAASQAPVPMVEEKVLRLDGMPVEVEASAAPYAEGGKMMIRVILRDITKRKEAEKQLVHQAFHDPLTQLPNRALLFERLRHRMALGERFGGKGFAILFLDVDRFKLVNDSLGHWMGDLLLLHVRDRIQSVLGPWDTLARLGGDEFTVLLEEVASRSAVEEVSQRMHAALAPAIQLGGHQLFVTASIGVALSETGYEEAEEVLRDADTAMYRAKAQGRAQTVFFDEQMRVSAVASLALERDLGLAARSGQFVLHYQPVVCLATGRLRGVEALIRWNHPERGLLLPGEFLARADEGGMIVGIDFWALEQACRQGVQWEWLTSGARISVNLSGRTLLLPDLSGRIRRILDQTGLMPERLALEITEQVLVESTHCIVELERLKSAGVDLYLDDFGTGYSSLSYLTLFPISRLKIDRSFVQKLEQGGRDLTVVRMVLALAEGLDLEVTAEGVESEGQADLLRSLGCQSAQGHYFGRPAHAGDISAFVARPPFSA